MARAVKRLYVDASCIIYLTEGTSALTSPMRDRIGDHLSESTNRLVTSLLSRLECRVQPLREQNAAALAAYDDFFRGERLEVIDINAAVIERATELRARYGFKTPDALHLATAIVQNADAALTGDANWQRCAEITVEVIKPAIAGRSE